MRPGESPLCHSVSLRATEVKTAGKVGGQSAGILRPGSDTDPLSVDEAVAALRVVSAEQRANPSQA